MNNTLNSKNNNKIIPKNDENEHLPDKGLFIHDDDQDWGSAGMNDIQMNSE
tara:strand:- start:220 stop:372 length:153 start_codon:yes stop_codon:yes gene_type:complete